LQLEQTAVTNIPEHVALEATGLSVEGSVSAEAARLQALASLEYDSDGDDSAHEFDLELNDEPDTADEFDKYIESHGYSEKEDVSFRPSVWNDAPEVLASHNCYMYALNDFSPWSAQRCKQLTKLAEKGKLAVAKKDTPKICKRYFHKPGYYFQNFVTGRAQTDVWLRDQTTCNLMVPMLAADSPAIVWHNEHNASLAESDSCPKAHYMAALFIHPKAGFHFYRRDHACRDDASKRCWSHKPGILHATDKDASGKRINLLLEADRNYGMLNYSEHCAFFCVPQNSQERTHSDARKTKAAGHAVK